jgi:hypothetical protein
VYPLDEGSAAEAGWIGLDLYAGVETPASLR